MSQQALVPCPKCQSVVPVELRHAGQDRTCPSCQHVFPAPKLRELKQFIPEGSGASPAPAVSAKTPLRNWLFVGGLTTALLAAAAAYLVNEQAKTIVFDDTNTKTYSLEVEKNVDELSPSQLWDDWDTIIDSRVLPAWELMGFQDAKKNAENLRLAARVLAGVSIAGGLTLLLSLFIGKPTAHTARA